MKKRIFIIQDESERSREQLSLVIASSDKFIIVGDYNDGESALKDIIRKKPDIILMGLDLPGKNGIETTQLIKSRYPHIEVLIFSDYQDHNTVFSGLSAGASGYLLSSINFIELLRALEEVSEGGAPMSKVIGRMVVEELHISLNNPLISRRERQVMQMIASGLTYSEISDMLNISPQTAKTHIRNIYYKLKVNSKSQAIAKAKSERLI